MSEFVKVLLECQEASKIPEQYDWFATLPGDWEVNKKTTDYGRCMRIARYLILGDIACVWWKSLMGQIC